METNVWNYALTAIFSIINKENEVHLVTFHFHTFTMVELNYNTHNKELQIIKTLSISATKALTQRQA